MGTSGAPQSVGRKPEKLQVLTSDQLVLGGVGGRGSGGGGDGGEEEEEEEGSAEMMEFSFSEEAMQLCVDVKTYTCCIYMVHETLQHMYVYMYYGRAIILYSFFLVVLRSSCWRAVVRARQLTGQQVEEHLRPIPIPSWNQTWTWRLRVDWGSAMVLWNRNSMESWKQTWTSKMET